MTDKEVLERYQRETEGHHGFQLKDGTYHEGYILEVNQDAVRFSPAPGVMDDAETWDKALHGELDHFILIQDIDLSSLRWQSK
jgi:hypothetical protein